MKKDRLILEVHRYAPITSNLVRLPDDVIGIIKSIQIESGLSASSIVSQIVRWAQDKIEIRVV